MNAIVSSLFDPVFQRFSVPAREALTLFCVFCRGKSATIGQADLLASYVLVLGAWYLVCRSSHIGDNVLR